MFSIASPKSVVSRLCTELSFVYFFFGGSSLTFLTICAAEVARAHFLRGAGEQNKPVAFVCAATSTVLLCKAAFFLLYIISFFFSPQSVSRFPSFFFSSFRSLTATVAFTIHVFCCPLSFRHACNKTQQLLYIRKKKLSWLAFRETALTTEKRGMAAPDAPVRPPGENANRGGGGWSFASNAMFYIVISLIVSNFFLPKPSADTAEHAVPRGGNAVPASARAEPLRPLAHDGEKLSVVVETIPPLFAPIHYDNLLFNHKALDAAKLNTSLPVDLSACFASNCSLTLKVTWSLHGFSFSSTAPLIRFFHDSTVRKKYLFGDTKTSDLTAVSDPENGTAVKSYFQPDVTLSPIVFFESPLPDAYLDFTPVVASRKGLYGPALYINNFWVLREHTVELNASSAAQQRNFTVQLTPLPLWKVLLYTQFDKSMASQASIGFARRSEAEETKRMLWEVSTKNPLLLAVTAIVTVLHSVFEFLAFSNDVKFWRGKKDFRGLSVRSIVINCYFQTIIFLYLLDSDETSWAVLVPSGLGAFMEYWKLTKTMKVTKVDPQTSASPGQTPNAATRRPKGVTIAGYTFGFSDSYDSKTQKHDDVAVRYLIYAMIPLLAGNAVYSALYKTHRNWYSFIISTQVQFIYSFGFAQMTPQIFINYKMKSVGQLPWRTFIYKSLNTVIDDLFAFVIKMPWLHRLACFQDDVVFAILLYQRWIYPVDMTRFDGESAGENEATGTDAEHETKPEKLAEAPKPDAATSAETKKNQ